MSKNETGGGEGIEVLKNEPFDNFPLLGKKTLQLNFSALNKFDLNRKKLRGIHLF